MPRPITAIIHHDALAHNLKIAGQCMPHSRVFAVVKANAYGHGIERVYEAFHQANGFAFLDIEEGVHLRALGCLRPLLLLEGVFGLEDLFICLQYQLSFTVHSSHQLAWLSQFAKLHPQAQFDVYLKMNSGMNRLGFKPEEYRLAWHQLNQLSIIRSITHMTHFSDADGQRNGHDGIEYQQLIFTQTIHGLDGKTSISNSAAILRHHQQLQSDVIRSGIMLYGSSPDYPMHGIQDWNLKPTMSLRSELIAIQHLHEGETIGYGSCFTADKPMRIGIVACGYADGYQRISPTGTPVLVNSIRTQTLGRVSMDMLTVDLTEIPNATIGSEVVLWGSSSQGAVLPIDEVAYASGTTGYELMCGVTARVNFMVSIQ